MSVFRGASLRLMARCSSQPSARLSGQRFQSAQVQVRDTFARQFDQHASRITELQSLLAAEKDLLAKARADESNALAKASSIASAKAPNGLAPDGLAAEVHEKAALDKFPQVPIILSPRMTAKVTRSVLENIDLMVCDMAGTTVQEGGLVYKILQKSMNDFGLQVSDHDIHPWHGAKKEAVIEHFARQRGIPEHELEDKILQIADLFTSAIDEAYFDEASQISHIDISLAGYFQDLRAAGIKIGLDTGYPQNIQAGLVKRLGFEKMVDGWVSSYDVKEGRPYPYMIYNLMERLGIENVKRVCKVGDSVRDIEEGLNAGCGLVVGVLSGADSADDLMAAGAHLVAPSVTSLPVPRRPAREAKLRLPDLS